MTKSDIITQIDNVATQMDLGHHWVQPRECIEKPIECIEKLARAARHKGISEAISAVKRHIDARSILNMVSELRKQKVNKEQWGQLLDMFISSHLGEAADAIIDEEKKIPNLETADDDAEVDKDEVFPDLEPAD
jgi:hypothetical protein